VSQTVGEGELSEKYGILAVILEITKQFKEKKEWKNYLRKWQMS
jgi:hypothetical protein